METGTRRLKLKCQRRSPKRLQSRLSRIKVELDRLRTVHDALTGRMLALTLERYALLAEQAKQFARRKR